MLTVSLFTSIVERRADGSWFAATRYSTAPSPWPLLGDVMTIQFAFPDAAHVQSRVVVIARLPAPPDAGTVDIEFATATWHFDDEGAMSDDSAAVQAEQTASTAATANWRDEMDGA
jgi:hypothetical protein